MTSAPVSASSTSAVSTTKASASGFRPDIQALRALAVVLVVIFHVFPARLTGGFVGVDVFFVVSGYLITAHLLREVRDHGRVRMVDFWARRARRLLPASLTVLVATVVATALWAPQTLWRDFARDVIASALYVQNWALASDAVDYMAAENAPSPVQHFWTLSAEEQFYFIWPVLIALTVWWLARKGRAVTSMSIAIPIAVVAAASLGYSVWLTAHSPAAAYFVTPTRAWEFAAGGLLACLPALAMHRRMRLSVFVAGVAMIVVAGFTYSAATPFPGYTALLPVIGTLLVLSAHTPLVGTFLSPLASRPIRWVGDTSYSLYLWHWPVIILWPYVFNSEVGRLDKLAILGLSVVLAGASYHFIENPMRRSAFLARRPPRFTLLVSLAAMLAIVLASLALWQTVNTRSTEAQEQEVSFLAQDECVGAAAMSIDAAHCRDAQEVAILTPDPLRARGDSAEGCMTPNDGSEVQWCTYGVPPETASETVLLIGDSHALHFLDAFQAIAEEQQWHLVTAFKGSCPFTSAARYTAEVNARSCVEWNKAVNEELSQFSGITRVFTSASSLNRFVPAHSGDEGGAQAGIDGYLDTWDSLPESVSHVYVLRDVPRPREDVLDCMSALDAAQRLVPGACASTRAQALLRDPAADASSAP